MRRVCHLREIEKLITENALNFTTQTSMLTMVISQIISIVSATSSSNEKGWKKPASFRQREEAEHFFRLFQKCFIFMLFINYSNNALESTLCSISLSLKA